MAGYNPNEHPNSYFGNEYINFNQFLIQHNIAAANQFLDTDMSAGATSNQQSHISNPMQYYRPGDNYNPYGQFIEQQASTSVLLNNTHFDAELAKNSNLLATANEFVPTQAPHSFPFANNYDMMQPSLLNYNFNRIHPDSMRSVDDKKDTTEEKIVNESLADAFDATRIGENNINAVDTNANQMILNRAGGAIKKEKPNQNARNDKEPFQDKDCINRKDKVSDNQVNFNRTTNKPTNVYNGYNNHRRHDNYYENRRTGTGRTASQYDNGVRHGQNHKEPPNNSKGNSIPDNNSNNYINRDHKLEHNESMKIKKPFIKLEQSSDVSQREKLIREIDSGRLECLVCCEIIKPFHSVWSCANCYHIMHLNCVIRWAASSKSEEGWRCCACQNITKSIPRTYYCFCGKSKNPSYNRSDIAHSCGDVCRKSDGCPHSCVQLCHPGPCPPCQATVTRKCGCGRKEQIMQCSQKDNIKCENICGKQLNCTVHFCEQRCHTDPCLQCDKELQITCHCTRNNKTVLCTKENNENQSFACAKLCNKILNCQNCKCKQLCHSGKCSECKLTPEAVKTCPCGKMPIALGTRNSCTDPIPVCTGNCKKPLPCGHACPSKCHIGPCPKCNRQTSVKCRCGHMDQMIKCSELLTKADDARCKKRCIKKRNCGKHKCNQECCIDFDHICPLPCSFNLSCGKHKCDQTCHKGRCQPCYRSSFDELNCECGANVIYPPVPCGTKKPACDKPCTRTHVCDHPVTHNCHSAPQCPPCMAFTTKYCYGKHEQRKIIPCSQQWFSCGLACGKPLKCQQHFCIKTCHAGPCEADAEVCKQNCLKPRVMCSHVCNAPCHPSKPCPDTPCRESVEVLCQCGLRKQTRTCHDFSTEYRKIATAKFATSMEDMQRGNNIELSDVLGPIKLSNNKTLDCNEECKVAERNRKLAIGLQIRNPDQSSKLQPKYSDFIRSWAKKDLKLVTSIHDKLTELVKLAKESKQKSRSYSFPTMNREKRQLVHEMCSMFGVESVAYDAEPNRNVVASATRDTSWLPSMSIMEVVQRESGQRRIPVPSLNAWGTKH